MRNLVLGFGRLPQTAPKLYWKNPKLVKLLGGTLPALLGGKASCSHSKGGYLLSTTVIRKTEVTAVLVEHALEHAAHEAENERLKTKQKIKVGLKPVRL